MGEVFDVAPWAVQMTWVGTREHSRYKYRMWEERVEVVTHTLSKQGNKVGSWLSCRTAWHDAFITACKPLSTPLSFLFPSIFFALFLGTGRSSCCRCRISYQRSRLLYRLVTSLGAFDCRPDNICVCVFNYYNNYIIFYF